MRYHPFRQLGLKMLAIVLASVLWLTVAGEHVVERSLRVPLEFRNIPEALEIVGNTPDTVDVRLRGSSAVLSRVQAGRDRRRDRPQLRAVRLAPVPHPQRRGPRAFRRRSVPGRSLDVGARAREIRAAAGAGGTGDRGDPAPGFVVGRFVADPATVEIIGPDSTRPAGRGSDHRTGVGKDAKARVRDGVTIGVVDSSVRLVQAQNANVTVEIWPAPVERRMPDVPVRWRNLGSGLRAQVSPQLVHVTVRGSKDPLAALRADSIQAFVDLAGLGSGRYNLRVQVDPAESFGVVAIDPAVVSVTIK